MNRRALYTGLLFFSFVFLWGSQTYRTTCGNVFRDDFMIPSYPNPGIDLTTAVEWTRQMIHGQPNNVLYPPAAAAVFLPFTFIDYPAYYRVFTFMLFPALFLMILLPLLESGILERAEALVFAAAVTVAAYNSGWFQFELERGNSNTLVSLGCAAGLYALSRGRPMTAALFFSAATQYRVYPAIMVSFLLLRGGIRPVVLFVLVNVAALFCAGRANFDSFLATLRWAQNLVPPWNISHSLGTAGIWYHISGNIIKAMKVALFGLFSLGWLGTWLEARKQKDVGLARPFTIAEAGVIGLAFQLMDLIPNISWDYKLGIQTIPFLFLITRRGWSDHVPEVVWVLIVGTAGVSYGYFASVGWRPKHPAHISAVIAYTAAVVVGLCVQVARPPAPGDLALQPQRV